MNLIIFHKAGVPVQWQQHPVPAKSPSSPPLPVPERAYTPAPPSTLPVSPGPEVPLFASAPNVEKEKEIVSSQHTHELEHSPAPTSLAPDVANDH